jgi:mono/diheme cytochrome c family protein
MKRLLFLILTAGLMLLFVIALGQDLFREWAGYQRRFLKTLQPHERRGVATGIQQILLTDLDRVDRCTTCHLAIAKPQLALAEEPFTAHPGTLLEWHPPEQFGCTVCHGGQGLATEVAAAHGDVRHWEQPLLRGAFVQASCAQCHGDVPQIAAHIPLWHAGRALFRANGCYGCHAVQEAGQTVSQELSEIGSKPYLLLEADFEMMAPPHDRIRWLKAKLRHPRMLNPGVRPQELPPGEEEVYPSAMPHFGLTDENVEALTVYLLSLTELDPPVSYTIPGAPEPEPTFLTDVERGQAVFTRLGCAGCHGVGGVGGRRNWNAGLGGEIPSLLYVKAYYGRDVPALKELIRNGRQPVPRADPTRPRPSLSMPAWKDRMSEEELDALVAYLFSLAQRLPQPSPQTTPSPPPEPPPSPLDRAGHPASGNLHEPPEEARVSG